MEILGSVEFQCLDEHYERIGLDNMAKIYITIYLLISVDTI